MNVTIRQATRDDASAVHKLHIQSVWELCKEHYSDGQIHGWLDHRTPEGYFPAIDEGRLFLAIEDSRIVGFGEAIPGEVLAIYVLPGRANEGIGTILLMHALEIAKSSVAKVLLDSTLNAADFYRRRGFTEIQRILCRRGSAELPSVLMEFKP